MADNKNRAPRASQRERVFVLRAEIFRMLDDGVAIKTMQNRIGLEDMPYETFYKNVVKLRDAPRPAITASVSVQAPAPAPASAQPIATEAKQPERESSEEKPRRKPVRRRRKYVDANAEYEKKYGKSSPPKWDAANARTIK